MTTAKVTIDAFAGLAKACASELTKAGYSVPTDDEQVVRAYYSACHRRVPQRKRTVHKAPYTVPSAVLAGEQNLLAKVAAGEDVRGHQSTKLASATFNDAMLNDFGVQHFHLGTQQHPTNPQFVSRTGPVLFAVVRPDDFYSLGVFTHDDWANTSALEIIHNNWPHLSASFQVEGALGLSFNPTDEQIATLRKHNINVLTQRSDGSIHAPLGGGQTLAGGSMVVAKWLIEARQLAEAMEEDITAAIQAEIDAGNLPSEVAVDFDIRDDKLVAVLNSGAAEMDLSGSLALNPI